MIAVIPRTAVALLLLTAFVVSVEAASASGSNDSTVGLKIGDTHHDRIEPDDPILRTERLRAWGDLEPRGKRFALEATDDGPLRVVFTSYTVRGHLVLRDATGAILAEDDVGWMNLLPRLVFDAKAGHRYTLEVASIYGVSGAFEIRIDAGPVPQTSVARESRLADEFVREGLAAVERDGDAPTAGLGVALGRLAYMQQAQGHVADAERTYRRALEVREQVLSDQHPEIVESLFGLARAVGSRDLAEAVPLYERAIDTLDAAPYDNDLIAAHLRHGLGTTHFHLGRYEAAKPWLAASAEIFEQLEGPEGDMTLRAKSDVASAYFRLAQWDEAAPRFEHVLEVAERLHGPSHLLTIEFLFNLAMLEREREQPQRALPLFDRAHDACIRAFGAEHEYVARCLEGLSSARISLGDYEAARLDLERALAIRERRNGPTHFQTAGTLHELGHVLYQLGIRDEARLLLERSLSIRRKIHGDQHPFTARTMQNLAALMAEFGTFEQALALAEPASQVLERAYGTGHPLTLTAIELQAGILQELGRFDEARPLNERVVKLSEERFGADTLQTANAKHNLALLEYRSGNAARAERSWRESIESWTKVDPGHPHAAAAAAELARMLRNQGRVDEALVVLDRMSPRSDAASPTLEELKYEFARALALSDAGRTTEAFQLANSIESSHAAIARHVLWTMTEHERLRFAARYSQVIDALLTFAFELDDATSHRAAYEKILAWKGRVSRSLVRSRESARRQLDDTHLARSEELAVVQSRLSTLAFARRVTADSEKARELEALRTKRVRLERDLLRAGGDIAGDTPVDLETLRSSIPEGIALIDFAKFVRYIPATSETPARFEESLCAWVLRREPNTLVAIDLGSARAVGEALAAYRRALTHRPGQERVSRSRSGAAVRRLIWDPIAAHVADTPHLVIAPAGFLASLPIESILLEDGSFVIDHHAVTYLQNLAAFPRAGSTSPMRSAPSLLAIGGVDYSARADATAPIDDESIHTERLAAASPPETRFTPALRGFSREWAPLPSSATEVRAVSAMHESAFDLPPTRIERADATEERVKLELPRHRVIHIATHGFFRPDDLPSLWAAARADEIRGMSVRSKLAGYLPGLRSGLVLAGANTPAVDGRDDGFLTAEEIAFLDLAAVDLVVLSACETALGSPEAGEGLLGLRRSLHQAGVDTVLSSVWEVEDAATEWLMREFYRRLWVDGESRIDALHGARRALAEHNRKTFGGDSRPSTWGAFVLSGAWR